MDIKEVKLLSASLGCKSDMVCHIGNLKSKCELFNLFHNFNHNARRIKRKCSNSIKQITFSLALS